MNRVAHFRFDDIFKIVVDEVKKAVGFFLEKDFNIDKDKGVEF